MIFDRFRGVLPTVSGEGTHFLIPWVQKPIIYSIRSRPRRVPVVTGSKGKLINFLSSWLKKNIYLLINVPDLQNVDITLRILFRPREESLPHIYANIGIDYDERILPSITTEVLKAVVVSPPPLLSVCAHILLFTQAQFDASELITQREVVSQKVNELLTERAKTFSLLLDDISIVRTLYGQHAISCNYLTF